MAKIIYSESAPDEKPNHFSLANFEPFTPPFDSDDPLLLQEAAVHPWLAVEYDEDDALVTEAPAPAGDNVVTADEAGTAEAPVSSRSFTRNAGKDS